LIILNFTPFTGCGIFLTESENLFEETNGCLVDFFSEEKQESPVKIRKYVLDQCVLSLIKDFYLLDATPLFLVLQILTNFGESFCQNYQMWTPQLFFLY